MHFNLCGDAHWRTNSSKTQETPESAGGSITSKRKSMQKCIDKIRALDL